MNFKFFMELSHSDKIQALYSFYEKSKIRVNLMKINPEERRRLDSMAETDPNGFARMISQNPDQFDGRLVCKATYIDLSVKISKEVDNYPELVQRFLDIKIAKNEDGQWRRDEAGKIYGYVPLPLYSLGIENVALKDIGLKNTIDSFRSKKVKSCDR